MTISKQRVELEFQRDSYLKLLESAETNVACRKWLRKIDAVNAEIEAIRATEASGDRVDAAPNTIVEDCVASGATQPMQLGAPSPDTVPHDDSWLNNGDDWIETIDTALYQSPRAPMPDRDLLATGSD